MPLPHIALLASASPYAPSSPCSATSTKASTVPPIMATAIWSARYSTATPTMARTHLAACIAGEADEAGFGAGLGAELDARPDVGPSAGLDVGSDVGADAGPDARLDAGLDMVFGAGFSAELDTKSGAEPSTGFNAKSDMGLGMRPDTAAHGVSGPDWTPWPSGLDGAPSSAGREVSPPAGSWCTNSSPAGGTGAPERIGGRATPASSCRSQRVSITSSSRAASVAHDCITATTEPRHPRVTPMPPAGRACYARVRSISTETVRSGRPTGAQGFSSLTRTPYASG